MASIQNHVMADKWKEISKTCRERGHSIHKETAVLHSGFGTRMSARQEEAMANHSCTAKLA
jgi:hypothetical protein